MISKKLRILFGIIFFGGMISVLGIGLEASQAEKTGNEVNLIQEISVDDEVTKTITIKLEDGISSSDEIH